MAADDADSTLFEHLRRVARSDQLRATVDAMLASRQALLLQLRLWGLVIEADDAEADVLLDQIQGALLRMVADGSIDAILEFDDKEDC